MLSMRFWPATSSISTDSVSSSMSCPGSRPDDSSAAAISAANAGSRSCRAETLTLTYRLRRRGSIPRRARTPAATPTDRARDERALLRDRDELRRRKRAEFGVLPTHQRFDTDDLARTERDDRLKQHAQLVVLDRRLELGAQSQPRVRLPSHRRVEERDPVLALLLGSVQRDVGVAHQVRCACDPVPPSRYRYLPALSPRVRRSRPGAAAPRATGARPSSLRRRRRRRRATPRTRRRRDARSCRSAGGIRSAAPTPRTTSVSPAA